MLTRQQVVDAAADCVKSRDNDRYNALLQRQSDYLAGKHDSVYVPKSAATEYRWLVQRSRVNIMPLVVDTLSQSLFVDGWRGESAADPATPWQVWQANRMDARQTGIYRASFAHGESWLVVLPGDPLPVLRPVSPQRMTVLYGDPVADEWPIHALERRFDGTWRLYEPDVVHMLTREADRFEVTGTEQHGAAVTPVVRFVNRMELDGTVVGEIDPLIAVQDQINSTTFGLLMAQTFAAHRQRWATGMVTEDEDGNPLPPPNVSVSRILTSDSPDTKFGEFAATDLGGYIESREASLRHAAIIAQVPPHHLLGQMVNVSAEALAAAEAGQQRKIAERKSGFGEAWESALRLAAGLMGDDVAAKDDAAQVVWRDTESRSLSQTADALGKIAAQLQVPPQVLWEKLPGITQTDVERWQAEAERSGVDAVIAAVTGGGDAVA